MAKFFKHEKNFHSNKSPWHLEKLWWMQLGSNERMTTTMYKYHSQVPLHYNWSGDASGSQVWMVLGDSQMVKLFFGQCSSHFWNLPCVYLCVGSINESFTFTWIPSPEWDIFLLLLSFFTANQSTARGGPWSIETKWLLRNTSKLTIMTLHTPHLATNIKLVTSNNFLI